MQLLMQQSQLVIAHKEAVGVAQDIGSGHQLSN